MLKKAFGPKINKLRKGKYYIMKNVVIYNSPTIVREVKMDWTLAQMEEMRNIYSKTEQKKRGR
jgi:hypothetical protein